MSDDSTSQSSWANEMEEMPPTTSTPESKTSNNDTEESKTPTSESKTPAPASHYKVTVEEDKVLVQEVPNIGEAIPVLVNEVDGATAAAPGNEVDGATATAPVNEVDGATAAVDQLATAANKVCYDDQVLINNINIYRMRSC